ncbi:plasmid partition protein ParA-like protein [Roseivivax marinus]|uniref:Plasmid partition protein ParA-like protein n=1 Tax=Roseivivax marinus TaxID=1379903 RepID=W4HDX9_9RHOB|nr:ParA family protein [Roseivivax marinus]ETW10904.1 plasmid partition protein ParA-like protein [Roseivivax marinus]
MIVSLISQKGGVGKSTIARLLGVEMARAGWRVLIADLDANQGTATAWKVRRDREELEPDVDVMKLRSVERAVKEAARYDLAILDGPAHAGRSAVTMARASELVLLPASYSLDDLEPQVRVAYELEAAGVAPARIRFALGRVRGSAAAGRGVRDYLRRAALTALDAELRELQTIQDAHMIGRCASETSHPHVNDEAQELAREIAAALLEEQKD